MQQLADIESALSSLKDTFQRFQRQEKRLIYVAALVFATVITLLAIIIGILVNQPDPGRFGFNITIEEASDQFLTQITPADWGFKMNSILLTWQGVWIAYAWSLSCRPSVQSIVSVNFLILYSLATMGIIIWIYIQANGLPQYSFPLFILSAALLYIGLGIEAVAIYKNTASLKTSRKLKIDLFLSRFILLNGFTAYIGWLEYLVLINFNEILQYFTSLGEGTSGTICLVLLLLTVLVYFNLEVTALDRYFRFVFAHYPILIWTMSAVINLQPGNEANTALSITILVFCVFLFLLKIFFIILFTYVRPIDYPDTI